MAIYHIGHSTANVLNCYHTCAPRRAIILLTSLFRRALPLGSPQEHLTSIQLLHGRSSTPPPALPRRVIRKQFIHPLRLRFEDQIDNKEIEAVQELEESVVRSLPLFHLSIALLHVFGASIPSFYVTCLRDMGRGQESVFCSPTRRVVFFALLQ